VAYAFSPIDLIPDFIPIIGYLDDIILVPVGVWIALKLIPDEVVKDCRAKAEELLSKGKPKNWFMGILVDKHPFRSISISVIFTLKEIIISYLERRTL